MYAYVQELSSGYLVMRPNLEGLLSSLAEWEPSYSPGTIVPGRSMGMCFASLHLIDVAAILGALSPGDPIYLVGNDTTVTYMRLIKLDEEGFVVVDTSPNLIQFEYDHSLESSDKHLTEGNVLESIQVIVPFVLLDEGQIKALFAAVRQQMPNLERTTDGDAFLATEILIQIILRLDVVPVRTIFTISDRAEKMMWLLERKLVVYQTRNIIQQQLAKL